MNNESPAKFPFHYKLLWGLVIVLLSVNVGLVVVLMSIKNSAGDMALQAIDLERQAETQSFSFEVAGVLASA